MSSVAQMLRQAEALKASVSDSSKTISETWVSRQKLEDIYKKVLLVDLEYALDKKVEQELWNHAFKNQITNLQTQAKDKQNIKRAEIQASLNLFLETASGFYLQFLQLLCTTFKLDLPFRRKSAHYGIMREKTPLKLKVTPPKKSSCLYVCQHCLVHLGDIARYRQQIDQAQTYYWHAASLVPFNGQPYNQLAILEAAKGNKLSTVFYYIRSLAVKVPFPAAATNLEKLYAKLTKDTPEFKGKLSASEMIVGFLQFHALVHLCTDLTKAQELSMKLATGLPAHVTSQSFPWQVLVQIVAVNIFAMTHIQPSDVDVDGQTNGVSGLTGDEEKCFDLVFTLTVLMLDILLQYTPKQENKVREYFTLPAVKLLLDWFRLNPHIYDRHVLKYSPLWTNLSKVLNSLQPLQPDDECIAKYEDLPLPEDAELRCFQPIEKAQSGYSYSRVPADGIPSHMEAHLRCRRLLDLGRRIVEEYPSVNLMAQGGNRGKLQFSSAVLIPPKGVTVASAGVNKSAGGVAKTGGGVAKAGGGVAKAGGGVVKSGTLTPPTAQTGSSNPVPSPERRSNRQNVAIQAIIQKQAQDTKDKPKGKADPGSPQYLLGVPTSEPVFFRPGSARVPQTSTNTTQSQASPVPSKPTGQTGGVLVLKNQDHLNSQPTKSVTIQQPKIQTRQQARQPVSSWQPQAKQQQQQQQHQQQQQQHQQQQQQQQQHQQQAHHDKGGWSTAQVSSQNQPQGHVMSWQQQPGSRPQLSPQPGQGQWQFTAQNNYGRGEFRPRSPMPSQTNVRHPGAPVQQPTNSGMFHKAQNNFPQPSGVNQDQQFSDSTLKGPLPQGQPSSGLYMPVSDQAGVTTSSMVHNSAHGDRFTGMDMNLHGSGERPSHAPRPGQPPMYRVPPPHNRFPPPPGTHFPTQLPDHMPASQGGNRPVGPTHGSGMGRGGAPFPGGPQNFSHAPGTERNHSGQAMQNQQQMSMAFQQGQFPLPFQGFMGFQGLSNNNQMKSPLESLFGKSRFPGDDIPPNMADIIGTLSKMAVQPPREHIMPQQRIRPSTFQGHAEGTPKPESFYSSQRSSSVPTVNIDVETKVKEISPPSTVHQPQPQQQQQQQQQQLQQHQQQQQQQPGTYSLFSGSPWLSSGDTKSIGSSPFSSQSSSIRNSPDPNSDMFPGDSKGMDMGLRYGTSEERAMKQMMDQQAPFMPNNMQSIWSNQAQSPLERLLELQKQQRQAEPH